MFDKCHVGPSHRRLAHPSWIASMKLMLDLLLVLVKNDACAHALSTMHLLKSMFVVSQLALSAASVFSTFCGVCLMSK